MHSFGPNQQVHVKMHIIKNTGSMNLMVDLNDKPLRLIPTDTTYMLAEDAVADKVICNGEATGVARVNGAHRSYSLSVVHPSCLAVDRFYRSSSDPMRYYLAINGGEVCSLVKGRTSWPLPRHSANGPSYKPSQPESTLATSRSAHNMRSSPRPSPLRAPRRRRRRCSRVSTRQTHMSQRAHASAHRARPAVSSRCATTCAPRARQASARHPLRSTSRTRLASPLITW